MRFLSLPAGNREHVKFKALAKLSLRDKAWTDCSTNWRAPFLPEARGAWAESSVLVDLFAWSTPGVKTHRTWVIAPDAESLERRWQHLQNEKDIAKKDFLFHSDGDRNLTKVVTADLGAFHTRSMSVAKDANEVVRPIRYGFRSFDRQWIIPDHRLLSRARPELWQSHSMRQIYLTAPEDRHSHRRSITNLHCLDPRSAPLHGRGGRAYPLWSDRAATSAMSNRSRSASWPRVRASQSRPRNYGLRRRRYGAFGFHRALYGRSVPTRSALPVTTDRALFDVLCARPRSSLAALLWRAVRRRGSRSAKASPRLPKGEIAPSFPPMVRFRPRPSRSLTRWITIRPHVGSSSARASSRTSHPRCGPMRFPANRARPVVQVSPPRPHQAGHRRLAATVAAR